MVTKAPKGDEPTPSDANAEFTWKVGLFGAVAALAGSAIGAVASLLIALMSFDHDDAAANRATEEKAYIEFLSRAEAFAFHFQYDALASSAEVPTIDLILDAQNRVVLFGTSDAKEASDDMLNSLAKTVGSTKAEQKKAFDDYADAKAEFQIAVRDALEVDD